ncbi:glycoside hydrolase family 19 protein [Sphingomonas jatrophae]|uniref:Putative chitinase n=1 Tax=Sphingomonas jatrophae TaxID=1166337 RepID=A0A1I6JUF6_9SPHN|nr:glycoside hydrolase family 19 protein [Sphingomonas jatrophae]SFR82602.1 putative chitinase [Sphingomonas jatrophae]
MAIDWRAVQARLIERDYDIGGVDGDPGPRTFTALLAWVAGRAPDAMMRRVAEALHRQILKTPIAKTAPRLANFLAQGANETGGFAHFVEDMRYTAAGMMRTWPSRFPTRDAALPYVGRPEALANLVYARPEMGNTKPGDGWRYRGRGWLQTTFRANYERVARVTGWDTVRHPELLEKPAEGITAAILFWADAKVNEAIDAGDLTRARRLTNGGTIGLAEVMRRHKRAMAVLG